MSRRRTFSNALPHPRPTRGKLLFTALTFALALLLGLLIASPPGAHAAAHRPPARITASPVPPGTVLAASPPSAAGAQDVTEGCSHDSGQAAPGPGPGKDLRAPSPGKDSRRRFLGEVGPEAGAGTEAGPADCVEPGGASVPRPPEVRVATSRDSGPAPLTVTFSGTGTLTGRHPSYAWDLDGDGDTDSTAAKPSHTYRSNGAYSARLTVTAPDGATHRAVRRITVGNTRPVVTFEQPLDHAVFEPGGTLSLTVGVADPEDAGGAGGVDCARLVVKSPLGRVFALRPLGGHPACTGALVTGRETTRDAGFEVSARYEDGGAPGAPALTGSASMTLRAAFCEAEWFTATGGAHGGASAGSRSGDSGGRRAMEIEDGDWIGLGTVSLKNIGSMTVRAASGGLGGTIELRSGSPAGPLLAAVAIPFTGGWDRPVSPTFALAGPGRSVRLFAVFTNPAWRAGTADLLALDWLRFNGSDLGAVSRRTG
ncbi:carbohydrate-binding protein [Streptomyces sp. NPDC091265]|uniref:carbohydrate-binding protein n=1 Tax=unclassified Streptomyces TaxID=2593676 RepID=UPI00344B91F8